MPDIIQIGSIPLDARMLVYIFSVVAGFFIMKLRLRKTQHASKPIFDLMLSNVLIIALFWKFGTLIFMPSILWNKPFQIIIMTGTWKEVLLGVAAAMIYTIYQLRKLNISLLVFLDLVPYGVAAAAICKSLLSWEYGSFTSLPWGITLNDPNFHYHPLNVYLFILSAVTLIWLWRGIYSLGKGRIAQDFLIYYGIGLWIISFLEIPTDSSFFFSGEQIAYLVMIVLGVAIQYIIKYVNQKSSV